MQDVTPFSHSTPRETDFSGSLTGVPLQMQRARDARAQLGHSVENCGGGCVRLRDAAKVELEFGGVGGERGPTGVLQTSHISRAQPARDNHTQQIAVPGGADVGHVRDLGKLYAVCHTWPFLAGFCVDRLVRRLAQHGSSRN